MSSSEEGSIRPRHMSAVPLRQLAEHFRLEGDPGAVTATGITIDSRDVQTGDLYVALPGSRRHGAAFAAQASQRGAVAILTDPAGAEALRSQEMALPVLVSPGDPRELIGALSARIYATAELDIPVFGVTGTNGKTSVVYLLAELLAAAGLRVGLSSTAERRVGDTIITSDLTSPEAPELHALFARIVEERAEAIVVEVSAHATVRHRIDGVQFDVVAFTNLSQDHLDDFGDMESYYAAKLALFSSERARCGVVVVDSPYGRRLAHEAEIPVTTLATEYGADADWHLAVTRQDLDGVSFVLQGPEGAHFRGRVPVFGRFMAENAAVALIMLHEAGIPIGQVEAGLEAGLIPVQIPGRLEAINPHTPLDLGPRFYVDYGHTTGAFEAMLDALGEVAPGRVIFLFGADGDRDTTKRESMGLAAGRGSDIVIVCDYHPRTEDPAAIRAQLIAGARSARHAEVLEEPDPRAAVRRAISLAQPGDVILYAGPGHEDYQEIAGEYHPYSARDEVRAALREAGLS